MKICPECRGTKRVEGAGFTKYPCANCEQTGFIKEKEKEEIKEVKKKKKIDSTQ